MPMYKVVATEEMWLWTTIEAADVDEARRIAESMEPSEFSDTGSGDFRIDEITEAPVPSLDEVIKTNHP